MFPEPFFATSIQKHERHIDADSQFLGHLIERYRFPFGAFFVNGTAAQSSLAASGDACLLALALFQNCA
jgi:hypothetical protein